MSTVIKLRTRAVLANRETTRQTLDLLSSKLSGFSYTEYGSDINIHYPPIDVYHRSGNLKLNWNRQRYTISGDPYQCDKELNKVLALLQAGYNLTSTRNFYAEKEMTEVTMEKLPGNVIKISGIIDEKHLIPVGA